MNFRVGFLPVVLAFGCATTQPSRAPVELTGSVVRTDDDPLVGLDSYDAATLFHLAGEAQRNGSIERSKALYNRLIGAFPDDELVPAARFNAGLLREKAKEYSGAIPFYEAIYGAELPDEAYGRRTWLDAHFRAAACFAELGQWWSAVALFERIETLDWLAEEDRLEGLVGRGIALQAAGDPAAAEIAFSHALHFYRLVTRRRRFDDRGLAAEAAFRLGDISRKRFEGVLLEFPITVLKGRLEEKCAALLAAQKWFLQAVRYGDNHTVAAAGYRIGSLYEALYETMMNLEVPSDLNAEQASVYLEEVHSKISVLVEKAIKIYEKSLIAGRRVDTASDWVKRTEAALLRLRALYLARS